MDPEVVLREVELPRGVVLRVRAATTADVPSLLALYDTLSLEDRYRRFFSAFDPDADFLERWVRQPERGGLVLVAEVEAPGAPARIVADAGYSRLEDGDGELGITVAPDWRGWLAPFLLDALCAEAAARGIPALEADVLATNRSMLSLARSRGWAMLRHEDYTISRVAIGTQGRAPGWPPNWKGPRVLVESPGGRWRGEEEARDVGLSVIVCPGPRGRAPAPCPMLVGDHCVLADEADAIVWALRPDDPNDAAVRDAHGRCHPGVAVVVDDRGGDAAEVLARLMRLVWPPRGTTPAAGSPPPAAPPA